MSDGEVNLGPLVSALEERLEADFPGWLITREVSGRWSAVRPGWGALYGANSAELRDRLRDHTAEASGA